MLLDNGVVSRCWRRAAVAGALMAGAAGMAMAQSFDADDVFLPSPVRSVSTVPMNGDVNPYGVAFVPDHFNAGAGPLRTGDILISNFNNAKNLQGTGTTIVRIGQSGPEKLFFAGQAPLGLTTALGVLREGFIVVGNGPTKDGTSGTATAGSLLVINNQGKLVDTFANAWIQYPWDMALVDDGNSAFAFRDQCADRDSQPVEVLGERERAETAELKDHRLGLCASRRSGGAVCCADGVGL